MNMRLGEHTRAGSGNIKIHEAYTSQSKPEVAKHKFVKSLTDSDDI
jgi:hypothetical protein